jgi:hypothetical protein
MFPRRNVKDHDPDKDEKLFNAHSKELSPAARKSQATDENTQHWP